MEYGKKVLVIIPAYNEEGSVGKVVEEVKQYLPGVDALVVNDGSSDHTPERAEASGAIVLNLPFNLGIGGAMQSGYKYAFEKGYEIAIQVDAEKESGPVWAKENDSRRTKIGTFLRKTSLDELPQLFNVLKGEMSLVGPRPERPNFVKEFKNRIPSYMLRHKIKAGMTGWAQVNGWRGNTSLEERIEHDLYYVQNWSIGFDVKILFMTLWRGFFSRSAY